MRRSIRPMCPIGFKPIPVLLVAGLLWTAAAQALAGAPATPGGYAVVVSKATHETAAWREVAEALQARHGGRTIVYEGEVSAARDALAKAMPRYACFLARPEEAGRAFVVAVHRMTRRLDDDPYTDVLWGILTGYEAADALRIANHSKPLVLRRALGGTGINLDRFDEGRWFSEGKAGLMWEKAKGHKPEKKSCPKDSTAALVESFTKYQPDVFVTSGHATERDWQIGYSYRNGQFRCRDGVLGGVDTKRKWHPIHSPNPKVYLPAGNCLIGHIPGRDCMATALMHTGGVYQMFGYTVVTWYGKGGWGTKDLFLGQGGRFTLAEAFFLNNQWIVHQLQARFGASATIEFERYDWHKDRSLMGRLLVKHKLLDKTRRRWRNKDEVGLLWDRDTVAFYGDPAWEARMPKTLLPWKQTLRHSKGVWTLTVETLRDGSWPGHGVMALLPQRVPTPQVLAGAEHKPLVTDTFVLVPLKGKFTKGTKIEVRFQRK